MKLYKEEILAIVTIAVICFCFIAGSITKNRDNKNTKEMTAWCNLTEDQSLAKDTIDEIHENCRLVTEVSLRYIFIYDEDYSSLYQSPEYLYSTISKGNYQEDCVEKSYLKK
jgi:hypothetical protein